MASVHVRKGDTVEVISGKDKGVRGEVRRVNPSTGRVTVEGVAMIKKHTRASGPNDPGGIIDREGTVDASTVMLVCPKCNEPTRVGHATDDGKKVRVCKKCGAHF